MKDIQQLALVERLTVGGWVRRTLREAREHKSINDPETKLKIIRRAAELAFPSADVEQMLNDIERGYRT